MVPALTTGGRSFKGAALYYLHDKRRAGEAERFTGERVAWTETLNLTTDDPERAWRMMATTAMKADELKAAAGVKATGRKLTKPALAYSLSWHPDEQPSRADQVQAAMETLKVLGLGEHQAMIVCHNDEPQPHVHVIVNRVHPAEGKAATLSNSKRILSDWALEYEKVRGKILCPKRAENKERRLQGELTRDPRTPRPTFEFQRASANDSMKAAFVRTEQKQRDAKLAADSRAMNEAHRQRWDMLKRTYGDARAKLYGRAETRTKEKAAEVKEAARPLWRETFKEQRQERRSFEQREKSIFGKLFNMAQTARELRQQEVTTSPLGLLFGILAKSERTNALDVVQKRQRMKVADRVSAITRQERSRIYQETKVEADRLRQNFLKQCAELKAAQAAQREALKTAWQTRNAERKAAYAPLRDRAAQWRRLEELGRRPGREQGQGLKRELGQNLR